MGLKMGLFSSILISIVVVIMLFQMMGDTASEVRTAAGNASTANMSSGTEHVSPANVYPLTAFFSNNGIVLLALMAGVVLAVFAGVLAFKR